MALPRPSAALSNLIILDPEPQPQNDVLLTRIDNAEDPGCPIQEPSGNPPDFSPRRPKSDDPESWKRLILALQNHLEDAIERRDFKESARSYQAVECAKAQMKEALKKQMQKSARADVVAKRDLARQEYLRFRAVMKQKEKELEEGLREQMERLEERQKLECEVHDRTWRGGSQKKRLFNRSSQHLRTLRVQQQFLLAASRFQEAADISSIADRQVEYEMLENQYQMFCSFAESRALLDKKHDEEIRTLNAANETKRGEFRHLKKKLEMKYMNRFNTLDVQEEDVSDPQRLWNRKHRNASVRKPRITTVQKSGRFTSNVHDSPMIT
jgi:hypothetical protein